MCLCCVFEELPAIVESAEFRAQMTRFLPAPVVMRTVDRPMFREHMVERIQGALPAGERGVGVLTRPQSGRCKQARPQPGPSGESTAGRGRAVERLACEVTLLAGLAR